MRNMSSKGYKTRLISFFLSPPGVWDYISKPVFFGKISINLTQRDVK